ncbi:synaptogenesis protein syg-2-like isoform X2 [Saccostrea cucullata]|uniref:synaptogenesis protein syg-2-like isoform X2 n=1 Tax=Saccostrea cuccullata TaxID=36930 RepID=UPI002ED09697
MSYLYSLERRIILVFLVYFTFLTSLSEASIYLTVFPPGPVEENQNVTIQCNFDNNPLEAAFYSTANNNTFCNLTSDSSGSNCKASFCSLNYYTTCPNDTTYRVVYPVPRRWNGEGVYCKRLFSDERSNLVNFNVLVSVTSVTLTPTNIVDAGKQINLTCQTDYCNPAASITWYKASYIVATPTTYTRDINSNGFVRTTSVLQYTGVPEDNGQQLYCNASNRPSWQNVGSNKYTLDIRYPPSTDPAITASPPGLQYNTGTTVTLTCQLSRGNPVATLSCRCKNIVITGTNQSNSTTAVSMLSLVMDSSYNNQQCTCTANHRLLTSPKSTSVSLTVFYPPSTHPVITSSPPGLQYDTGTIVTLTCQLSGGNPLATLSWRCKNIVMTGTHQKTSITPVSMLPFVIDSSYNNQQCTCTANHSLFTSPKSRSVSLTVFYNNVITSSWNKTYSVKEHERFQLVCEVDGNPSSNITWVFVRNNSVIIKDYNVKKSSLVISSANCLDFGTYRVFADNGKGRNASITTKLLVKCKPRLYLMDSLTPVKLVFGKNNSLQIFVRILLFPPATQTTWHFSKEENENKVITDSVDGYRIMYTNAEFEQNITLSKNVVNTGDFGDYTLRVENEIGAFTRIYNVVAEWPPLEPMNFTASCENSIKISWISNFNGGDDQRFQVSYSTDGCSIESFKVLKEDISDEGNGRPHSYIPSLEMEGPLWFTITASNKFGNTTSDDIFCNAVKNLQAQDSNKQELSVIGGTIGGVVFVVLVAILIFLNTKYQIQIKCVERKSNQSGVKNNVSDNTSETAGPQTEMSVQYEELKKTNPNQENSYENISSQNKKRISGATYEDYQPQNEERKYEEFTGPKDEKDTTYTNSKVLSPANVYENMSFKGN